MNIRPLEPADIPQVIGLWQKVGDYHDWMNTPEALARKAGREARLFLVAEADDKIVGTVMGGYDGRMGQAGRLAVTASHRRRGIAEALMAELETRLGRLGAPQVALLVWHENAPAISLYHKLGFEMLEGVRYMRKRLTWPHAGRGKESQSS